MQVLQSDVDILAKRKKALPSKVPKRIRFGVKRFSFCDFDDEVHELSTAWSEEGNESGCKKMLEKLTAKEFAGVLKQMKHDLEDTFFSALHG